LDVGQDADAPGVPEEAVEDRGVVEVGHDEAPDVGEEGDEWRWWGWGAGVVSGLGGLCAAVLLGVCVLVLRLLGLLLVGKVMGAALAAAAAAGTAAAAADVARVVRTLVTGSRVVMSVGAEVTAAASGSCAGGVGRRALRWVVEMLRRRGRVKGLLR
jgi:hypothetical protein